MMIFLIDNYILPIEEFKLNDDKIEIWNTEFTDKSILVIHRLEYVF